MSPASEEPAGADAASEAPPHVAATPVPPESGRIGRAVDALGIAFALLFVASAAIILYEIVARYAFGARPAAARYPAFLAGSLAGLGMNVGVTGLGAASGLPPLLAKLVGIGTAFVVNFALNVLVVFPRGGVRPPAPRGSGPRPWRGRASRRPS